MSPRLRHRGLPLLLFWVLLVAGCTPGGAPHAPAAPQQDGTARAVLGDLRTVDPCTLTDPAALQAFGSAENAGTVSLDYCLLHVKLANGSLVQLAVGELGQAPDRPGDPVVPRGSLRIVQNAPLPGHCTRQVLFADDVALRVSADLLVGDPASGLCGIAEAGADAAAAALEQHRVGHRDFPADSLALVDPCDVLDSAAVQQVPGLEEAQGQPSPAGHQCSWGEQVADSPRVQLTHTAGEPPRVLHGAAVEETIAGRRTVVSVVGGDPQLPLCSAETGHLPFGAAGQVEVAQLVVAVPGMTGIDACEFARGLAGQAWPHLPPPAP
ncbi:hypothetical protein ABT337_12805 [Saccharopolyspora hirsuta]|uniref:DUF3558 domain-containing protein n=1 Tax=Saccharopolyspora hirsuta TaxID=1837 RepID=A0A5M7BXA3_SACHI|nr:hypothetical protein [Saccharopolyspora hirsuta]KAA5832728.1 hypothetical protein F1721_17275 [Saccharopolyspora hirsuta]